METEHEDSDANKDGGNECCDNEDKYKEGSDDIGQEDMKKEEDEASAEEDNKLLAPANHVSGFNESDMENMDVIGEKNLPYDKIFQLYLDENAGKVTIEYNDMSIEAYSLHQKG